jgi:signal transduction histidine kinase
VTAQLATSGVEVHIDDEGPGIAEGDQRIIFERFSRLSADQTGAGLGLAITKWIVEEHGGEIFVSGSPLGGSRFTVRLPKESATSASESKAASASKAQEVESSHAASIS